MKHRRLKPARILRRVVTFCKKNSQLLVFIGLLFIGVILGCVGYSEGSSKATDLLFSLQARDRPVPTDFWGAVQSVVSAGFSVWVQLGALFLLGITAFGCMFSLLGTVFFGLCFGVAECQAYGEADIGHVLLCVTIPMAVSGVAVLIAAMQSFRFSCLFTRQLLPGGAHCGGMWQPFKRYVLIYLLCALVSISAAVLQVVTQLL